MLDIVTLQSPLILTLFSADLYSEGTVQALVHTQVHTTAITAPNETRQRGHTLPTLSFWIT